MENICFYFFYILDNSIIEDETPVQTSTVQDVHPKWNAVRKCNSFRLAPISCGEHPRSESIFAPSEYFKDFFDGIKMDYIVQQSNLYAVQSNPSKPLMLTCKELEKFFSIILRMAIISLPRSRLYWSKDLGVDHVSGLMSRARFEEIKRSLHFNDNSNMVARGDENFDKLFKIRPVVTHLQLKFRAIPMDQKVCVDEQMIPFKGNSGLKQYIPSKPHKYGYKVFVLCDSKGLAHDFDFYTGKILPPLHGPDLGASSNIVLRLAETIPSNKNHILVFDNWFNSVQLQCELAKRAIYCLGTVRTNRLQGCNLLSDKELKKKGRGAYHEKECVIGTTTLRAVKWFDSKAVSLLTSFESAEPAGSVKRWDKKTKAKVNVPRPQMVATYNKLMGGVDLLDALIGMYRIKLRSKKYYHRIFFHLVDMVVVNSWLIYRRDCNDLELPENKQLSLLEFKNSISLTLAKEGQVIYTKKRGRKSISVEDALAAKKMKGHNTKSIPLKSVRHDNTDHFPIYKKKRGRCKIGTCKSTPHFFCHKCEAYLCIDKNKNCFLTFHKE